MRRDLVVAYAALGVALAVAASALTQWPPALYAPRPAAAGMPPGGAPGSGLPPSPPLGPTPGAQLLFSENETTPPRTPAALPTDLPAVYCHYRLPAVPPGQALSVEWSCAGRPLKPPPTRPQPGRREGAFRLSPPQGTFAGGIYVVRVLAGERVLAEGSFLMHPAARQFAGVGAASAQPTTLALRSIEFCTQLTDRGEPQDPGIVFPLETRRVYVVLEYAGVVKPTELALAWLGDGQPIRGAATTVVALPPGGRASAWLEAAEGETLPKGEYTAILSLAENRQEVARARFAVQAGAPPRAAGKPTPGPTPATGTAVPRRAPQVPR